MALKTFLLWRLSQSKMTKESVAEIEVTIAAKKTVTKTTTFRGMLLMNNQSTLNKTITPPKINRIVESDVLALTFLSRDRNCLRTVQAPSPAPVRTPPKTRLKISGDEKWYLIVMLSI